MGLCESNNLLSSRKGRLGCKLSKSDDRRNADAVVEGAGEQQVPGEAAEGDGGEDIRRSPPPRELHTPQALRQQ